MYTDEPGIFSSTWWACFAEYIQHALEQYALPLFGSLDPTHFIITTSLGSVLSDGLRICPSVGPDEFTSLSN